MVTASSWGRLGNWPHEIRVLSDRLQISRLLTSDRPGIAYGMGRSYGDVCLNPGGVLWSTSRLDRFIHFDERTGRLSCEAGVLLRDIQRLAVPRGWMLPVTPGTQMVTVGGAIANDVHGKNHHGFGSFGDHIQRIKLIRTDGSHIECGPNYQSDWFAATVGGLGLTGVIVEAEIQLRAVTSPWLDVETIPYQSLDEFFHWAGASEAEWEHTVSWVDCTSGRGNNARGIFMRANPSKTHVNVLPPSDRKLTVPFVPPLSLVNRWSLRPFSRAYFYMKKRQAGRQTVHYEPFFYPLDHILEWNRLYGPKGFFQYQSVVPRNIGREVTQAMLNEVTHSQSGSILTVLKTFGDRQSMGMLSFPRPGVTLALDFPNQGQKTLNLFERLDAIVREAGGRIYPAKDARMPQDLFQSGYPRLVEFLSYRDPGISSALSRRLMGD